MSGWLIGLPLNSGPISFILALEQGNEFASAASKAIMLGIMSVFVFSVVYSRLAIYLGWVPSVVGGLSSFFLSTYLLDAVSLPLLVGFASALVAMAVCLTLMPKVASDKLPLATPSWELPARMISATALVFIITGVAQVLGPQLTGLLTPFPIYATVLGVFIHRSEGGGQAVRLLRGVVAGSLTSLFFLLVISATLVPWGVGNSFVCAICIGLLTHALLLRFLKPGSSIA